MEQTSIDREAVPGLVVEMGAALHRYGASTPRIEEGLTRLSARFGIEGQFYATPTLLLASFGHESGRTYLTRLPPAVLDLARLTRVDALLTGLLRGTVDPAAAASELVLLRETPRGGAAAVVLGHALAAAATARLVGGGFREIGVAAAVGLGVGVLARFARRRPRLGRVQVPLAAFVAAFASYWATQFVAPLNPQIAMIAGVIVLIPGLTLTLAMTELVTGHLAAGTARFVGAVVLFLTLAFGVALGMHVAEATAGPARVAAPAALPGWTLALAVAGAPVAMGALFRAPRREFPWVIAGCVLAYAGTILGSRVLGGDLGIFLGGVTAGTAANGYARWRNRPSAIVYLPALLMLVPGSLGFGSVAALLASEVTQGIDIAFTTLLMAVALVTGMLVAAVLVPPRRVL